MPPRDEKGKFIKTVTNEDIMDKLNFINSKQKDKQ